MLAILLTADPPYLADRLLEVRLPVLVVTGDADRIVPTEQSIRLSHLYWALLSNSIEGKWKRTIMITLEMV